MRTPTLVLALLLLGCPSQPAATPPAAVAPAPAVREAPKVTGTEARALIGAGALLVDVRTPEEYEQLHLDGARNVPLQTLATGELSALPKNTPIIVYCAVGARSARAAELLASAGYDVRNLGAMENWKK